MRTNTQTRKPVARTHQGAVAAKCTPLQELQRSVCACLLWEDSFYESGEDIAKRISSLIKQCDPADVFKLAVHARTDMNMRHVPLLLAREMARIPTHRHVVSALLPNIIQRADELAEFVAIYWKDKKQPLSAAVKRGLAQAFHKFNEHQLAKYNSQKRDVKLRDVLMLSHPKPATKAQAALWKKVLENKLDIPDTWENELSAGADKKETFTRLIKEKKLGALALLRNLRGMGVAGVDTKLIRESVVNMNTERVLPYRFITAAKYAPQFEPELETAMFKNMEGALKIAGKTVLLIDVSGSMDYALSTKSEMTRLEAACGLAIMAREICEDVDIYTFSNSLVQIAPRHGFALRDAIVKSQHHGGTELGDAVRVLNSRMADNMDRMLVFTDEQSRTPVPEPTSYQGYMINVATDQHGVGYGRWLHITGFSEAIIRYIQVFETEFAKIA